MTPPRIPKDINLYGDSTYGIHIPYTRRRFPITATPATVIAAPRRSWCEDTSAALAVRLKRLICDEVAEIDGVRVQRTDAFARLTFHVNDERSKSGTPIRYTLTQAIERVMMLAVRNG